MTTGTKTKDANRPVKIARDDMLLLFSRAYERIGRLIESAAETRDNSTSDYAKNYYNGKIMAYREAKYEITKMFNVVKEATE